MPRIRLAYWHGDNKPGDEVDVTDEELQALQRDGRVAAVLGYADGGVLSPKLTEVTNDSPTPEPVQAAPETPAAEGRTRKAR